MKKVLWLTLVSAFIMLPFSLSAQNSSSKKIIPGSWGGKLSAQGMELRIIFNIKSEADVLKATLDSPDQGGYDIALGKVTLDAKKLIIEAPDLKGEYSGVLTGDSTINGTWTQNGATFPLNLKKQAKKLK
jgi:uncharacterized protein